MPKIVSENEYRVIKDAIIQLAGEVAVAEILSLPQIQLSRRTLQRRLEELCQRGELIADGAGRGRKYRVRNAAIADPVNAPFPQPVNAPILYPESDNSSVSLFEPDSAKYEADSRAWLSADGRELRSAVRRPLAERSPIGYDPSFLHVYRPNETFYLPEDLRKELKGLGEVGVSSLPAGTYLRQILSRLLIDLAWNSSRLEGNTYSLIETERLLQLGVSADGKATHEAQMILNHKAAIEMLADATEEIGFNRYTLCNLHALLAENLMSDPVLCGSLRHRPVGITGTTYMPLEVPQQIEEYFTIILTKAALIQDPFEASFFVMVHLPYLQAFEDVNKRLSRLAANIPMIRHNLCPLSFVGVEADDYVHALLAVYEFQRVEYLRDVFAWAYRRSAEKYKALRFTLGDPDPFRMRYREELKEVVREIVRFPREGVSAEARVAEKSAEIPEEARDQFLKTVMIELRGLHEGNIARYRLRPREFACWKSGQVPAD